MQYRINFAAADLANVRFAVSPLWELTQAVRVLVDPSQQRFHLPWLDQVRPALDDLDVEPLLAVLPVRGYNTDLVSPQPRHSRPSITEQLEQVRSTPLAQVKAETAEALANRGGQPVPPAVARLAKHPKALRDRLVTSLENCWHALLEPHWQRVDDLLTADIAHQTRILGEGGLGRLFATLHPDLEWRDGDLWLDISMRPARQRQSTKGHGVLLMPSAFAWPRVIVIWDYQEQPTIVYPARGVAELWQPVAPSGAKSLGRLMGSTRATLLASLLEPASTSILARRHSLAPATVSEHLSALADAGLLSSARQGRSVIYAATDLGDALLRGAHGPSVH